MCARAIHPKLAVAVFKGEVSGTDGGPIARPLALNYNNLSPDELLTLRRLIDKAAGESAVELDGAADGWSPAKRELD